MTRLKWLLYTALLGASPMLARLLVAFLVRTDQGIRWVSVTDVIGFGLILAITNINILEHRDVLDARKWKTLHIGLSLLNVVFLVVMFAVSCISEAEPALVDDARLVWFAVALTGAALVQSFAVSERLEWTAGDAS